MDGLKILMMNKVFQSGDMYWLQNVGTAIRSQQVPSWATIFFGIHEEAVPAKFGVML